MQGRPAFDDLVRRCGGKPDRTSVKVRCVVHEDASPSLSITLKDDGTVVWFCHAGCDQTAVTDAIRGRWPDLWKPVAPLRPSTRPVVTPSPAYRHVCYYTYTDETGKPVHRVERREATDATGARSKKFPQSHWNGTGWSSGTKPLPTLHLYHLPDIMRWVTATVWYCEGEKDADRLQSLGLVATTNAKEAPTLDRLDVTPLRGRRVYILVDNDAAGRKTADHVARKISPVASSVRMVALPGLPEKGDVSDWLDARMGTVDDLEKLGSGAPEWSPTDDDAAGIAHVVEPEPAGGAVTRRLSDVEPEPVAWLWGGWLPMGKVVVLDGDPGTGKSTITLDIAARLSRGDVMPDGSTGALHDQDAATIMVNVEDGAGDTMRPRFDAATGKPSMVHLLDAIETVTTGRDGTHRTERVPFTLPDHTVELEDLIVETGACLVVIDPLMAILSGKVQANSDQDVRRALSPLAAVADRTGACILVVRHLRKSEGGNHLYRGGGSIGIIGAARAGLVVAFDPDDETPDPAMRRRVFAVAKSNLAAIPSSLTYSIVTARVMTTGEDAVTSRIAWGDTTALTAADLNRPHRDQSDDDEKPSPQVGLAMEVLRDILRDGAMPATDVYRQAGSRGIANRTLERAKPMAGVRTQRQGKVWFWSLPDDQKPQHSQPTGDVGTLGDVGDVGTLGDVGMGHMNRDGAPIGSTCGVPTCPNTATTWHPVEGWLCSDCHRDVTAWNGSGAM